MSAKTSFFFSVVIIIITTWNKTFRTPGRGHRPASLTAGVPPQPLPATHPGQRLPEHQAPSRCLPARREPRRPATSQARKAPLAEHHPRRVSRDAGNWFLSSRQGGKGGGGTQNREKREGENGFTKSRMIHRRNTDSRLRCAGVAMATGGRESATIHPQFQVFLLAFFSRSIFCVYWPYLGWWGFWV